MEIRVEATWKSIHYIEAPEGWQWDGELGSILALEDIDSSVAELVDWTVNGR